VLSPAVTVGGRWGGGECTARVLNKNRTTGKENLQQET